MSLDEANARYQGATRMHGRIVHLDEVLTMSARMGAATGNPGWEARYRSMEPQLESAIARAVELAPSRDIAAEIQAVDAAGSCRDRHLTGRPHKLNSATSATARCCRR